jgi:hypothetical protein
MLYNTKSYEECLKVNLSEGSAGFSDADEAIINMELLPEIIRPEQLPKLTKLQSGKSLTLFCKVYHSWLIQGLFAIL